MNEVKEVDKTITIDKEEYLDLYAKSIDWDNLHCVASRVTDEKAALQAIRVMLGIWGEVND